MIKQDKIVRKPTRTLSGVSPLAVFLKPSKCKHGTCLFCPSLEAPQSYTPKSPAVMRAIQLNYDPAKQVHARLKAYNAMNHPTDKIELIIMGGTFLDYEKKYQEWFVKECYDALNNKKSKNLDQAKKINETSVHRCVALCIETRPDVCTNHHIKEILNYGCTRVELGVQAIDDKIYKICKRGHKVKDVIDATQRLKNAGFKIGYHLMPGLPGSDLKKDLAMFKKIFSDSSYRPDQLKIYPCQVIKGSQLESFYYSKKYIPYNEEQLKKLLIKFLQFTPRYCRIMRIMREIPPEYLVAGILHIDLRKDIEQELLSNKDNKIKEIRFREAGLRNRHEKITNENLKMKVTKYNASDGVEYYLEIINNDDILFALCRLRIYKNHAIIRELHVYGKTTKIGEVGDIQHLGFGKQLIIQAEKITKSLKIKNLKIISGVGVRKYYEKLGYKLDQQEIYMEKNI